MKPQPKHNITNARATDLLYDGAGLIDVYVEGEISISTGDSWDKEVIIENCVIEYFIGSSTQFEKQVKFLNSHFKKCQFTFSYFPGGLIIENCIFDSYLDLQAGGHNKLGNPIRIINNDFADFVNFFDCWYEGEVIIKNNNFQKMHKFIRKAIQYSGDI